MDLQRTFDTAYIQEALSGQMEAQSVRSLIDSLQARLDDLLPTANRVFANVVTEAFDMTQGRQSIGLEEALSNISTLQAELDAILYPVDTPLLSSASIDPLIGDLPSPEMLFSDPDHVPRFVDWTSQQSTSSQHDLPMHNGIQNGISSSGSLFGFNGNSDSYDA